MKHGLGIWLLSVCSVLIWAQAADQGKKGRNTDVNEYVNVVNVEMIARVQRNGQPVGGLQKATSSWPRMARKSRSTGSAKCAAASASRRRKRMKRLPLRGACREGCLSSVSG